MFCQGHFNASTPDRARITPQNSQDIGTATDIWYKGYRRQDAGVEQANDRESAMLVMPRIERRPIERLKSNRTLTVNRTERARPISRDDHPPTQERRRARDRRKQQVPVARDRRRSDRRTNLKDLPQPLRKMLEHSRHPLRREGVYVDETV